MRKMRFFGVALVAALACAGSAALAAGYSGYKLHGNRKGMKVAEKVMHAYAQIPGYMYTESNFFQMKSSGGKSPSFHYRFGYGSLRSGWTWANEKGAMGLSNNDVIWWRDDLTPTSPKRAKAVEIVFKGSGGYWAFGSSASHGCFHHLQSGSQQPYQNGFVITGRVDAPQDSGNTIGLSYTYPWGETNSTAKEMDAINSSSYLVESGQVSIGGYSFNFSDSYRRVPGTPQINLCK
jgi:hypothetical protein